MKGAGHLDLQCDEKIDYSRLVSSNTTTDCYEFCGQCTSAHGISSKLKPCRPCFRTQETCTQLRCSFVGKSGTLRSLEELGIF